MNHQPDRTGFPWRLLAVFLLFTGGIALVGHLFHHHQAEAIRREKEAQLAAVADLKVNEIVSWRNERLGDATIIWRDTLKGAAFRRWVADPLDAALTEELRRWLGALTESYGYESASFLDMDGRVLLSYPAGLEEVPNTQGYLKTALERKRPTLTDLHRFLGGTFIHMDLVAPVRDSADENAEPFGAVRLEVNPATFLYPLIQKWPTVSATAETLLVRREGDEVLFLNELRHHPGSALTLSIPMSRLDLPATRAVLGAEGSFEGRDYRGVPVLTFMKAIQGTNWFMISKVDREEIYAPIRREAIFTTVIAGVLILAAAAFVFLAWSRQRGRAFQRLYELETIRREMAERYEILLKYANDSIILADADGVVVEANERASRMYGYPMEEFLGLHGTLLRSGDGPALGTRLPESEKTNGMLYEALHRRKDGGVFPVEVSLRRVTLSGKNHQLCIIRDITERKRSEERILRLNRLYAVLSNINQAVVRVRNRDRLFQEVCRIAVTDGRFPLAWVGCACGPNPGGLEPEVFHSTICASFPRGILADGAGPGRSEPATLACQSGRSVVFNDLRPRDGMGPWRDEALQLGFLSCAAVPLFERGLAVGALTVYSPDAQYFDIEEMQLLEETGIDISFALDVIRQDAERVEAETALKRSERKFRTVFDSAGDAIFIHDLDGKLLEVNRMACESLGYSREELLGRGILDVHPAELRDEAAKRDERLWREGRTVYDTPVRRRDGSSFPAEVSGRVIEFESAPAMLKILRDVSERKRLEAQISQSQKMEVIGRLAGGIAHEFNNILGIISGYVELSLTWEGDLDREIMENLLEVLKAVERARDVVRQILVFSRRAEQEKRPVRVAGIARDALKLLRASLPSTIEIRADLDREGIVSANPTQIHQLLMNLCTNARDAMRQNGGLIEIRLDDIRIGTEEAARLDPDLSAGTYLRLTVSDTGTGIDPAIIGQVFDPYFTTKPAGEGTGIGLALVRGIAKDLGGTVSVTSQPGQGAAFEVLIPRMEGVDLPEEEMKPSSIPRGRGETVLVVDDEPLLLNAMRRILESLNYRIVSAENGPEAIETFRQLGDELSLMVSDVTMPGMTGLELTREIHRIRPEFPVLLCTGYSDLLPEEEAESLGIRGVLMKPVVMREMASAVRRALGDAAGPTEA